MYKCTDIKRAVEIRVRFNSNYANLIIGDIKILVFITFSLLLNFRA